MVVHRPKTDRFPELQGTWSIIKECTKKSPIYRSDYIDEYAWTTFKCYTIVNIETGVTKEFSEDAMYVLFKKVYMEEVKQ